MKKLLEQIGRIDNNTSSKQLLAGVAKRDITYYGDDAIVNDVLYAKALVLDDGKTKLAIITMDTPAIGGRKISCGLLNDIGEDFLPALRDRVEAELAIPATNILVNASHTHTHERMLCEDFQQLERTFDAVKYALQNMTPVKVGTGIGHENRIMINRTLRLKDGSACTIRHTNPCPRDEDVADIGPVDPDIGILRIDRLDGSPFAVVYNFACHLLVGVPGGGITANYAGFASKVIEENLGGDVMALFIQGAGGDITELLYKDVSQPRDSDAIGTMLGLSTLKGIRNIKTGVAKLSVISKKVEFPRRTDIQQCIEYLNNRQNELLESLRFTSLNFKTFLPLYIKYSLNPEYPSDYSYRYIHAEKRGSNEMSDWDMTNRVNIKKYLANIYAMEELARIQDDIATFQKHQAINKESSEPTITAEIMGIKIGNCVLISAPVEMLTEVGLNVKKAAPYEYTFIAAFSNGYMHYGPPADAYDKGGYEVTECLLAPEWQAIYEKTAEDIIRKL